MDQLAELIEEIRRMNHNIEELLKLHKKDEPKWVKLPEAARIFGLAPAKFRSLCYQGVIPSALTSQNSKLKHYLVNVDEAHKALLEGGYLRKDDHIRKETMGRKPKVTLKTK